MSSSYIVQPPGGAKKDDTLILMINDNGVITVDQNTLQSLIMNQSNATVSVVKHSSVESEDGDITLTVDPPNSTGSLDSNALVDPFMEMNPEELKKLESALQSEEAKHILGENVTAMLDMLTIEELQNSIRYSIELDHSYTSRSTPGQSSKSASNLALESSSMPINMDDSLNAKSSNSIQLCNLNLVNTSSPPPQKLSGRSSNFSPKVVLTPTNILSRPRRASAAGTTPKSANVSQDSVEDANAANGKDANEVSAPAEPEEDSFPSSESSTEKSDSDDSDFGPPVRRGVRSRGAGRRGLNTRGGSQAVRNRRLSNKLSMDSDQVKRLDQEMAAAVNAMKTPEKMPLVENNGQVKLKKQLKTLEPKSKEEVPVLIPAVEANVLQTTNQVKANLIKDNMIEGGMILTKPGQDRKAQNSTPQNFLRLNARNASGKLIGTNAQNSKLPTIRNISTLPAGFIIKQIPANVQGQKIVMSVQSDMQGVSKFVITNPQLVKQPAINFIRPQKTQVVGMVTVQNPAKIKVVEAKKELKGKTEPTENPQTNEVQNVITEVKNSENPTSAAAQKKNPKKETRKVDPAVGQTLGPALFSAPDIIRRVGPNGDGKGPEIASTSSTSISDNHLLNDLMDLPDTPNSSLNSVPEIKMTENPPSVNPIDIIAARNSNPHNPCNPTSVASTLANSSFDVTSAITTQVAMNVANVLGEPMETDAPSTTPVNNSMDNTNCAVIDDAEKTDVSRSIEELLKPTIDSAGIDSEENLLETLGMGTGKHEDEFNPDDLLLNADLDVDLDDQAALEATAAVIVEPLVSGNVPSSPSRIPSNPPPPSPLQKSTVQPEKPSPLTSTPKAVPDNSPSTPKKDQKQPIQVMQKNGRVITLPPIEAPTTRSKRLQATAAAASTAPSDARSPKTPKSEAVAMPTPSTSSENERPRRSSQVSLQKQDMIYMGDNDDKVEYDDEGDEEGEDDPNRLWCICRAPHNNRFMICCDKCSEWFHGKCVNITRQMGADMEQKGIDWLCPSCKPPKIEDPRLSKSSRKRPRNSESKSSSRRSSTSSLNSSKSNVSSANVTDTSQDTPTTVNKVTHCVVCKKEARKNTVYCSDKCILEHADKTSLKDKPAPATPSTSQQLKSATTTPKSGQKLPPTPAKQATPGTIKMSIPGKSKTMTQIKISGQIKTSSPLQGKLPSKADLAKARNETHVVVYDKKTGEVLRGQEAPTVANLKNWLKEHPTYAIVKSSINQNPALTGGKLVIDLPQDKKLKKKPTPIKNPGQAKMIFTKVSGSKQTVLAPNKRVDPSQSGITPTVQVRPSPKPPKLKQATIKSLVPNMIPVQQTPPNPPKTPTTPNPPKSSKKPESTTTTPSTSTPVRRTDGSSEHLRSNVRRTLADMLTVRLKEDKDIVLSPEDLQELGVQIEAEMFKMFKDTGAKYKALYRRLSYNIKDPKNCSFYRKIANKSLTPESIVRLNPEEMANEELAEWREKENKHQLEMIKKNELEMMAQAKSIVVKTHKGEQIIESAEDVDVKTPVQDIVSALNNSMTADDEKSLDSSLTRKKEKERDREKRRERSKDRGLASSTKKHKHSKDGRDRSKDRKTKGKHKDKERERKDRKDKDRRHSKSRHKDKGLKVVKEPTPPMEDRLWKHVEDEKDLSGITNITANESDISDRELPSSTVTINESTDLEALFTVKKPEDYQPQTVWQGLINMVDVAKFHITASDLSGCVKESLCTDIPEVVNVVGRIGPDTVWDYIHKMRKNPMKDIIVMRLSAINDEEKIPYFTLYSYLNSRNRLGVVETGSKNIKDFYIMPFSNESQLPSVLLPIDGPGFEENRPHLLLGIIVYNRRKRPLSDELKMQQVGPAAKIARRVGELGDRSYTPPPAIMVPSQMMLPSEDEDDVKQEPETTDPSMLLMEDEDDENEPYSPGAPVDDDMDEILGKVPDTAATFQTSDIQRKMEELSRQIEEKKQQIQFISESTEDDASPVTLPGLGLDPEGPSVEPYSPSNLQSFTPPPQALGKLSPLLDKVSNITIPNNLQEILANIKRQETSMEGTFMPSKQSATFMNLEDSPERYSPTAFGAADSKEPRSTLSTLTDADLIRMAAEMESDEAGSGSTPTPVPPPEIIPFTNPPPPVSYEPPPPGCGTDNFL